MPFAIAIVFLVVVVAVCLIGILRSLVFLLPFYAIVSVAVYFLWWAGRDKKHMVEKMERESERQRLFNEQEANAWRAAVEKDRRAESKRDRILRSIDRSRDQSKD